MKYTIFAIFMFGLLYAIDFNSISKEQNLDSNNTKTHKVNIPTH